MSDRVLKVNQLIKKELSQILLREFDLAFAELRSSHTRHSARVKDVLVTITRVETSPNLIQSKVYVSVLPDSRQKNLCAALNGQVYFIQQKLNKRLTMRPTPKIIFLQEKETEKAAKVEEVLEQLKKEEK